MMRHFWKAATELSLHEHWHTVGGQSKGTQGLLVYSHMQVHVSACALTRGRAHVQDETLERLSPCERGHRRLCMSIGVRSEGSQRAHMACWSPHASACVSVCPDNGESAWAQARRHTGKAVKATGLSPLREGPCPSAETRVLPSTVKRHSVLAGRRCDLYVVTPARRSAVDVQRS